MSDSRSTKRMRVHERLALKAFRGPTLVAALWVLIPVYVWYLYWFITNEPQDARSIGMVFITPLAIGALIWDLRRQNKSRDR